MSTVAAPAFITCLLSSWPTAYHERHEDHEEHEGETENAQGGVIAPLQGIEHRGHLTQSDARLRRHVRALRVFSVVVTKVIYVDGGRRSPETRILRPWSLPNRLLVVASRLERQTADGSAGRDGARFREDGVPHLRRK